jgi:hypothetical protein
VSSSYPIEISPKPLTRIVAGPREVESALDRVFLGRERTFRKDDDEKEHTERPGRCEITRLVSEKGLNC